jgi:hypothetical protein
MCGANFSSKILISDRMIISKIAFKGCDFEHEFDSSGSR